MGRELRVQQRQRGGAALPIPHERHGRRSRVDEQSVDVSRRLQRFVVQQPGRHADLGQPAGPDGFERRASGHGRMALWPSNSLQTLSAAGYTKFARRTQLTGSLAFGWANNDEPLHAVHHQQCAATTPVATRDDRRLGARRSPRRSASSRARRTTGDSAPGSAATPTTTTCPTPPSTKSSVTTRRSGRARRAVRCSSSRTPATRSMPMPRGRGFNSWRSPLAYTNNHNSI